MRSTRCGFMPMSSRTSGGRRGGGGGRRRAVRIALSVNSAASATARAAWASAVASRASSLPTSGAVTHSHPCDAHRSAWNVFALRNCRVLGNVTAADGYSSPASRCASHECSTCSRRACSTSCSTSISCADCIANSRWNGSDTIRRYVSADRRPAIQASQRKTAHLKALDCRLGGLECMLASRSVLCHLLVRRRCCCPCRHRFAQLSR